MLLPKKSYKRSPKYRKWIGSLPCAVCKIEGHSQAAHLETGGRGIKCCDSLILPLCASRPLILGCHAEKDQYKRIHYWNENFDRARSTARRIHALWEQGRFDEAESLAREF